MQQNGHRPQPTGGTLRLQPNIPAEIALKFRDGREVEGQFGPQVMFTLVDGRKLYLNPGPAERIRELGLHPGELFSICKRQGNGNGRGVEWDVRRVDPPARNSAPRGGAGPQSPGAAGAPTALESQLRASIDHVARSKAANGALAQVVSIEAATITSMLRVSVDALVSTQAYAKKQHGVALAFNEEDVRAIATTLFITATREARFAS